MLRRYTPPATFLIFALNAVVFAFFYSGSVLEGVLLPMSEPPIGTLHGEVFRYLALIPEDFWEHQYVWQPLTSMFLHISPFHFLVNMMVLFGIGTPMELTLGSRRFAWLYIISGLCGALFMIFPMHELRPAMGASAALFGLLGSLAVFYPRVRLQFLFLIPIRAWQLAIGLGVLSILARANGWLDTIAHLAHLGGLVGGVLYARFALKLEVGSEEIGAKYRDLNPFGVARSRKTEASSVLDLLERARGATASDESTKKRPLPPVADDRPQPPQSPPGPGEQQRRLLYNPQTGQFYYEE